MTVVTSGQASRNARAAWTIDAPPSVMKRIFSTRSARRRTTSGLHRDRMPVNRVSAAYRPASHPESSGTLTMMPARFCGTRSKASAGSWWKTFRRISRTWALDAERTSRISRAQLTEAP